MSTNLKSEWCTNRSNIKPLYRRDPKQLNRICILRHSTCKSCGRVIKMQQCRNGWMLYRHKIEKPSTGPV